MSSAVVSRAAELLAQAAVIAAIGLSNSNASRMTPLSGISYTLRATSDLNPGFPGGAGARHSEWVGEAVVAAGRGRMVVVSATVNRLFQPGDYALFDSTSGIIVKPAQKTFSIPSLRLPPAATLAEVRTSIRDLKWAIDSLGDHELVSGVAAAHYRVNVTYRNLMESPLVVGLEPDEIPQPVVTQTVDYWYAKVDGLPRNAAAPFSPHPMVGGPAPAELSAMWAEITRRLADHGTPLRSSMVARVKAGTSENVTTNDWIISDIHRTEVDAASLMLPEAFAQEGTAASGGGDAGHDAAAKWRRPPGAW